MGQKEFGIKFIKTDNGFKLEVSGDEEIINAHREMAEAWKGFLHTAKQAAKTHHRRHREYWENVRNCEDEKHEKSDMKEEPVIDINIQTTGDNDV